MFFHKNTRNGCVVLTYSSVKHSFKTSLVANIIRATYYIINKKKII